MLLKAFFCEQKSLYHFQTFFWGLSLGEYGGRDISSNLSLCNSKKFFIFLAVCTLALSQMAFTVFSRFTLNSFFRKSTQIWALIVCWDGYSLKTRLKFLLISVAPMTFKPFLTLFFSSIVGFPMGSSYSNF